MIQGLTVLLFCQLVGEALSRALSLGIPGPVLGLIGLFAWLSWRGGVPEEVAQAADGLLAHLSLLFVPAGVGVIVHLGLLRSEWLPIVAALVGSAFLTVLVTALVMRWMVRHQPDDEALKTEGEAP